jgi:hypothetical protein
MPKRTTPYTYRQDDDPITLAERFNLPPSALLAANPGGAPFSVGQTINIPQAYEYRAPATTGPNVLTSPNSPTGSFLGGNPYDRTVNTGYSAIAPAPLPAAQPPAGYGPNAAQTFTTPRVLPNDSWYRTPQQAASEQAAMTNIQNGTIPTGSDPSNTDYANTRAAQQYAAAGTSFVNQMRWDPQAKKFVSIGRLLKQGKLDLKGNWRKTSRRQRQGNRKPQQQLAEETKQDFTLANSFISFGVSSG